MSRASIQSSCNRATRTTGFTDRKSVVQGKSVDHCVTGVQTCALPISLGRLDADTEGLLLLSDEPGFNSKLLQPRHAHHRIYRSEERRAGKECRSLCDWSSDVCSSDLARPAGRRY